MYEKGTGNDKRGKDAGNRTLVPYRNFSQGINRRNAQSLTLFSMGYFKNTTVWGGHYGTPLVTLVFLKVERQTLVTWGILMCFLKKWH